MNNAQRQRLLIIVACTGFSLLLLDYLVIEPLIAHWSARSKEIATLEKQLSDGRALQSRGENLKSRWSQMQNAGLARDAAQAEQELISSFDRWGRSAGVDLGSIKPQWRKGGNANRYSLLECKVDATGNMNTVARFLYEIERSPMAIRVENLELSAKDEAGSKITINLTITGLRMSPLESSQ